MLLITGLPDIMRKEGWAVAARCMERWFRLGPHELTPDEKAGRVAMDRLDGPTLATDILTMDWAKGFGRVRKAADELTGTWNSPKGRIELLAKRSIKRRKSNLLKRGLSWKRHSIEPQS